MKDIPVEELAAISPEIHEAAVRVGCIFVSITGQIWPGGRTSGPAEKGARFVEYSWERAAVVNGRAVFEDDDPKAYSALLNSYGIGDEPYVETDAIANEPPPEPEPMREVASPTGRVQLTVEVLASTKLELERQAKADSLTVAEFLDWKFQPPPSRSR